MFSKIFLNQKSIINNVLEIERICGGKVCVMVKANAYGHGMKEVLTMLSDTVDYFGVSNQWEGEAARKYTNKTIIVFGACEDYQRAMQNDLSFALFSFYDAKRILKIAERHNLQAKMHLCLNTGMNRYGIKDESEMKKIIKLLSKKGVQLEGIYTHFSSLTTDKEYTQHQKEKFDRFLALLPNDWQTIKHVGGGRSIFENLKADVFRVGLEVYGYGNDFVKPVLSVESEIVDLQKVSAGEHVGYLCGFTAEHDMTVATIPLGYGDGLPRKLSNKLKVSIGNKTAESCGNICMDAFMVDVTDISCRVGDRVKIFDNASLVAPQIESTEYEVLTNLSKFRGERIIR